MYQKVGRVSIFSQLTSQPQGGEVYLPNRCTMARFGPTDQPRSFFFFWYMKLEQVASSRNLDQLIFLRSGQLVLSASFLMLLWWWLKWTYYETTRHFMLVTVALYLEFKRSSICQCNWEKTVFIFLLPFCVFKHLGLMSVRFEFTYHAGLLW